MACACLQYLEWRLVIRTGSGMNIQQRNNQVGLTRINLLVHHQQLSTTTPDTRYAIPESQDAASRSHIRPVWVDEYGHRDQHWMSQCLELVCR